MPKTIHELKLEEQFAWSVITGDKRFEIRLNDRGYQKGDIIRFTAVNANRITIYDHPINKMQFEITYVLNGWGLKEGYVAFGIREMEGE